MSFLPNICSWAMTQLLLCAYQLEAYPIHQVDFSCPDDITTKFPDCLIKRPNSLQNCLLHSLSILPFLSLFFLSYTKPYWCGHLLASFVSFYVPGLWISSSISGVANNIKDFERFIPHAFTLILHFSHCILGGQLGIHLLVWLSHNLSATPFTQFSYAHF